MSYLTRIDSLLDTPNSKPSNGVQNLFVELNGNITWTAFDSIFSETLTALSLSGDVLSYVDENGNPTDINLQTYLDSAQVGRVVSVTAPDNQTLTLTKEDGSQLTLDMTNVVKNLETVTGLAYDAVSSTLTYTAEDGSTDVVDLQALTSDIFVSGATFDSSSMTLTLTDNDNGTGDIVIDFSTLQGSMVNNNDGTYTYDNGNGTTTIIDTAADSNPFNGTTVGMTGTTTTQAAVENVYNVAESKIESFRVDTDNGSIGVIDDNKILEISGVNATSPLLNDNILATNQVNIPNVGTVVTLGFKQEPSFNGAIVYNNGTIELQDFFISKKNVVYKNVSYTINSATDYAVIADSSNVAITITLPNASTNEGLELVVKVANATNGVTIDTEGGTIDGFSNYIFVSENDSLTFIASNGSWYVI